MSCEYHMHNGPGQCPACQQNLRDFVGGYEGDELKPGRTHTDNQSRKLIEEMYRVKVQQGPVSICPKHDWNMGTYCAACRDEALELYRAMMNHRPPGWSWTGIDLARGKDWTGVKVMSAPTKEQLKDPKWWDENAPDWAECIWVIFDGLGSLNQSSARIEWARHGEQIFSRTDQTARKYDRPTKPASPEWDGEGLPPVGCECEYALKPSGPWFRCEIVSHNRMVIRCPHLETDSDRGLQIVGCNVVFRPLRTAEQREREEVYALAQKAQEAAGLPGLRRERLEALYDAGLLRKGE